MRPADDRQCGRAHVHAPGRFRYIGNSRPKGDNCCDVGVIGETIAHYRILDKLGEGGMGVVYRAQDQRLGRQVALKFLSVALIKEGPALERFQREARAASSLNHPHICAIYDVGTHDGRPFLVMELLHGRTLRQRAKGGALPVETLLDLGEQIADALDAAHSRGIVHRDIKPANIFVTEHDQIKILDFGLAKLASQSVADPLEETNIATTFTPSHVTDTGQTLGTLSYMSPEQMRGEELDGRSDLFSFGVVLYELAAGREPFRGRTPALVTDAILHDMPAPPSAGHPSVPADLDEIVLKALEKDRDLRYQSAADLRADIKRLKRESGSQHQRATGTSSARRTAEVRAAHSHKRLLLAGLASFLLLAAVAVAAYRWLGRGVATDSVAVLPFVSVGKSADTEYLTEGITESLINGLSQLSGLRVSARSIVFRYRDKDVDPRQVGRELGVKAIVTGRVSARGDRLVIQADLMNVTDGTQLWGDQYNVPSADLLDVQDRSRSRFWTSFDFDSAVRKRSASRSAIPTTPRRIGSTCRGDISGTKGPSTVTSVRLSSSSRRSRKTPITHWPIQGWPTRTCRSGRTTSR